MDEAADANLISPGWRAIHSSTLFAYDAKDSGSYTVSPPTGFGVLRIKKGIFSLAAYPMGLDTLKDVE